MSDESRNLNPHKAARLAMIIWANDYVYKHGGGSMDFWDSLSDGRKATARKALADILKCRDEAHAD